MSFKSPVIIIFGFIFVTILLIMGLPVITSNSAISATDSVNLTSFGSSYSEMLPLFGIMIGGGVIALALDSKR